MSDLQRVFGIFADLHLHGFGIFFVLLLKISGNEKRKRLRGEAFPSQCPGISDMLYSFYFAAP